jgi:hypothetical protein
MRYGPGGRMHSCHADGRQPVSGGGLCGMDAAGGGRGMEQGP